MNGEAPTSGDEMRSAKTASGRALPADGQALAGVLHVYVAFDWGDEIRLDQAQKLAPAESHLLPRRRRTPASIGYRPPPLRYPLPSPPLNLPEVDKVVASAEATVFERTESALKLVGDQYLARVYQLVGLRFHLGQWAQSIERSLAIVQSVYQVVSDQSATYRSEFLEILIIALILFEIVMAFVRH